jgi:hypothetical protein
VPTPVLPMLIGDPCYAIGWSYAFNPQATVALAQKFNLRDKSVAAYGIQLEIEG